VRYWYEAIFT